MVYLNGAEEPMDLAYQQPVRASRVEVSEDCLSFLKADGTLVSLFRQVSSSQLARDERIRTSGKLSGS